jgi:hypothetical protein
MMRVPAVVTIGCFGAIAVPKRDADGLNMRICDVLRKYVFGTLESSNVPTTHFPRTIPPACRGVLNVMRLALAFWMRCS